MLVGTSQHHVQLLLEAVAGAGKVFWMGLRWDGSPLMCVHCDIKLAAPGGASIVVDERTK
eukprot:5511130-Pyramimonas_sp.AAC.1